MSGFALVKCQSQQWRCVCHSLPVYIEFSVASVKSAATVGCGSPEFGPMLISRATEIAGIVMLKYLAGSSDASETRDLLVVRKRSVHCGVVILIYTTVPLNWICWATFTVSRVMLPHARWCCRNMSSRREILTLKVSKNKYTVHFYINSCLPFILFRDWYQERPWSQCAGLGRALYMHIYNIDIYNGLKWFIVLGDPILNYLRSCINVCIPSHSYCS